MPKASPIQSSFSRGVQSGILAGNIQAPAREQSFKSSQNLIPLKQGPLVRRGGTKQVSEVKASANDTLLVKFRRNPSEAYMLEFGDLYVRFFKNEAPVTEPTIAAGAITASTNLITVPSGHGLVDNDQIIIKDTLESTINDRQFIVTSSASTAIGLKDMTGTAVTFDENRDAGGTVERIYTLTTIYRKQDLFYPSGYDNNQSPALDFWQSLDTLFITHPNYTSKTLKRDENDTSWTIATLNFKDGPYLPIDTSGITMTLGGTSGTVSCTADADIFKYTDSGDNVFGVHRRIRFNDISGDDNSWSWATMTGYTSARVVEITFQEGTTATTTPDEFRLGFWHEGGNFIPGESQVPITGATRANPVVLTVASHTLVTGDNLFITGVLGMVELNDNLYVVASHTPTTITLDEVDTTNLDGTGFTAYTSGGEVGIAWKSLPRNICMFEDRFCFSGAIENSERIDMTTTSGYSSRVLRFDPSAPSGLVSADDALSLVLGGAELNHINWMRPVDRGLAVGTTGSEGLIQSTTRGEGLTPANASYRQQTTLGSSFVRPVSLSGAILFAQRASRRLHEYGYNFEADKYKSPDMTALAEDITRSGIKEVAWQQEPNNTLWVLLSDGTLIGFTYDRDEAVIAWHKHALGGTDVLVKSIQVIPSADASKDVLWMIVERTIDGNTVKFVEYMESSYEDTTDKEDAYHMDAGKSYSGASVAVSAVSFSGSKINIQGVTRANPCVITTSSPHGMSVGDHFAVEGLSGATGMEELNTNPEFATTRKSYIASAVTTSTITVDLITGSALDSSSFTASDVATGAGMYVPGSTVQELTKVTTATNTLSAGDYVAFTEIAGTTELNGNTYLIIDSTATTVTLANLNGSYLDSSAFTAYTSGGNAIKSLTQLDNMHHLEGETVKLLIDGKTTGDVEVTAGVVEFDGATSGTTIQVGLHKDWFLNTLPIEAGSADGTAQGKTKRIHSVTIRLKDTLGFQYGPDSDTLDEENFTYGQALSTATSLFTGDITVVWPGGWDTAGEMYFLGNTPHPVQIQALMPQVQTQDDK